MSSAHTPSDTPESGLVAPARRDFLFLVTGSVAAVGTALTLWPFIDQMNPDAATIAAAGPVDVRHESEARIPIHSRRSRSRLATSASRRLLPFPSAPWKGRNPPNAEVPSSSIP